MVVILRFFSELSKMFLMAKTQMFSRDHLKQTTKTEYCCLVLRNVRHVTTSLGVCIDITLEVECLNTQKMMIYDMEG